MADVKIPFINDLVIPDKDGKIYYVPESEWKKREVPDELRAEVQDLIQHGTLLAAMPQSDPGIGAACYLINLANIITDWDED